MRNPQEIKPQGLRIHRNGSLCAAVGTRVQRARKQREWSQSDLARVIGMTRSSIANLETGRQRPPVHVALLIASVLNVAVTDLLPSGPDLDEIVSAIGQETAWADAARPAATARPVAPDGVTCRPGTQPVGYSEQALGGLYAEIGERVRRARKRREWTQLRLGRAVGLTQASITNLEAGRQRPPVDIALLIAQALGVPVDELLPPGPQPGKTAEAPGR